VKDLKMERSEFTSCHWRSFAAAAQDDELLRVTATTNDIEDSSRKLAKTNKIRDPNGLLIFLEKVQSWLRL
jgi:hypothetical protein